MKYHIDTIPIWDAYKTDCECPMCLIRRKNELSLIETFLGGSVMEPDTRIEVNQKGFCRDHQRQLYAQKNRLGLALMTHTNMLESNRITEECCNIIQSALDSSHRSKRLFHGSKADQKIVEIVKRASRSIRDRTSSCIICQRLDTLMDRYFFTMMYMYEHESSFQKAFKDSKGLCQIHFADALEYAIQYLPLGLARDYITALIDLQQIHNKRIADELYSFTTIFDYRNQSKDFGHVRDALPRAIDRTCGITFPKDK